MGKLIERLRLVRYLQRKAAEGYNVIPVPSFMAGEVQALIWSRCVERAADKWASRVAEVSLSDWTAAVDAEAERWRSRD